MGFILKRVNHSVWFGAGILHTNTIESLWHQIKLIIFYAIEFILVIFFTLYLTGFCGIYIATKTKLVESYGIALIEVVIIKILYGLVLGILRKVSLVYKINILYKIVKYLDLYVA